MARKPNLLNVRELLKHMSRTCENMLDRDGNIENGLRLASIDRHNLSQIKLITNAILRKHSEKLTRKDIYVETETKQKEPSNV